MINAALVALAFGLLGLVIWRNREKIHEVFGRPLDCRLLALAEAIYLVGMVSTFVRWYLLVRVIDPRFTLRAAVLLGFIGNVFNLVIPGAVGGDLIKAAYLVRMHVKKTQAIASMVIDRIIGLLGLFTWRDRGRAGLADGPDRRPPADPRGLGRDRPGRPAPGRDLRPGVHPAASLGWAGAIRGCT